MFSIVYSPKSCLLLHLDAALCIWFGMEWGLQRLENQRRSQCGLCPCQTAGPHLSSADHHFSYSSLQVAIPHSSLPAPPFFFFKSLLSSMSSITNWKSSRFRMCSYLPNNNLELHAVWWYSWSLQGYGSMKMVSRNTLTVIRKLYLLGST